MATIKIAKVTTIPTTIEKDVIYFLKNGSSFDIYATNNEGSAVLKGLGSKADITNIMNLINQKANISDLANVASGGTVTLTKEAVGLGNVDNTSDLLKPISNAVLTALNLKVNTSDLNRTAVDLGNVDNTNDLSKPISNATQAALNLKADLSKISNVDNVRDLDKPVSTATQAALDLKADDADLTTLKNSITATLGGQSTLINQKANALELTTHEMNTSNPHQVTKDQVGLGSVDNTSDINKPISKFTQNALNLKADITYVDTKVAAIATGSNVTLDKNSVGLGNVDNTSDLNKPLSTAAINALALKASLDYVNTNLALKANIADLQGLTAESIGLGNVNNTSDLNKPLSNAAISALALKADSSTVDTMNTTLTNLINNKVDKTTYLTDQTNLNITLSTFSAIGVNTIIPNQW